MPIFKNLSFEWLVGLRYTRSGRRSNRNRFISFISLISTLGIALGVAALIVVLSVMNGFQKEVRDRMLSVLAHIEVQEYNGSMNDWQKTAKEALQHHEVNGAAPYVLGQGMLMHQGQLRGAVIRGVLPEEERQVSDVADQVKWGSFDALKAGEFNIVIGSEIARRLRVRLGDRLPVISPQAQMTMAGVIPRLKQFRIVGIFEAGHFQFDSTMAFMHIEDAKRFFRLSAPSGLRLRVEDMQRAPMVARELTQLLTEHVRVQDWSKQNRNWFAAVQTEKKMMFLILMLIIAVAAFNLVSTLVMSVTEKQADIAILRTLGASPRSIMKIFMIQGALSGILGTLLGVTLGVTVALNIDVIVPLIEQMLGIQFLPKEIYVISRLPSDLRWSDVGIIAITAMIMAFLATIYPSWSASRTKPAEALRYE